MKGQLMAILINLMLATFTLMSIAADIHPLYIYGSSQNYIMCERAHCSVIK